MRRVGWFLIALGACIGALWLILLTVGEVPEIAEGRIDIWFHIAAEVATAVLLVVAGRAVLRRWRHAEVLASMAVGALAYTSINSAGYFADTGDWVVVAMFGLVLVGAGAAGWRLLRAAGSVRAVAPGTSRVDVRPPI